MRALPPLAAVLSLLALAAPASAAKPRRPAADPKAIREAVAATALEDTSASPAAYAHFLQAQMMLNNGDPRGAVDELRLALATDEANPLLLTRLAETWARLGDMGRAERELRRVVESQPDYYPARVLMGRVLVDAGRPSRARIHLRRAIQLRPQEPEAYLVLAQSLLDTRSPDEAMRVVEELGAALPGEASGYRRLGLALAERGDTWRAERMLSRAAERAPGDVEVWTTLARLQEESGRISNAEEALARALRSDPDNGSVLLWAGRLALRLGPVPRARGYFERLLSLSEDPELTLRVAAAFLAAREPAAAAEVLQSTRKGRPASPRIAWSTGLVLERLHRFTEAAASYAEVPPDSEFFQEARRRHILCLSMAGQHAEALGLLQAALAESPEDTALRILQARALERSGRPERAEATLQQALARAPSVEVYEALASTWQRQGRHTEALALLQKALAGRPRDTALRFVLANAWLRKGDAARALAEMRAVVAAEPQNAAALNFIGYLLAGQGGDLNEAERLVQRALEFRPDTGAFLDSLGFIYYRRGDYARALEVLERAAALEPDEPTILEHLGDTYRKLSRLEDAARAWRQALEALQVAPDAAESPRQREGLERKLKLVLSTGAPGR